MLVHDRRLVHRDNGFGGWRAVLQITIGSLRPHHARSFVLQCPRPGQKLGQTPEARKTGSVAPQWPGWLSFDPRHSSLRTRTGLMKRGDRNRVQLEVADSDIRRFPALRNCLAFFNVLMFAPALEAPPSWPKARQEQVHQRGDPATELTTTAPVVATASWWSAFFSRRQRYASVSVTSAQIGR